MARITLTDRGLRALSTDKPQEDVYDKGLPCFLVRVGRSGSKTFYFRYRAPDGRFRRIRIGRYPAVKLAEARDRARVLQVEVMRGEDPAEDRQRFREAPTMALLAGEYLERYAKRRKRTWVQDEQSLARDVLPVWGARKAAEIKKRDVVALLDGIVARGAPITANRTLALVRKIFNWAVEVDLLESNPTLGVRLPASEAPRTRILSEEEIRTLWNGLADEHPVTAAAFRLLLLTAQRRGEVIRMQWDHLEGDVWTIPAELSKSGRPHAVPLSRQALKIVESLRGLNPVWVLPSHRRDGRFYEKSLSGSAARIRQRLGMAHWTPHDLRRTAATRMTEMGIDEFHVARVLGHSYSTVTATYNRYSYLAEKREALNRWGERLQEIVRRERGGVPGGTVSAAGRASDAFDPSR